MNDENSTTRWCILRTAGPRTLPLARSLAAAGIEAWTPTLVTEHKRPRSSLRVEREAPILPTFVFVAERDLPIVHAALFLPVSPHPPFHLFRYVGEVYRLRPGKMAALRAYEQQEADAYRARKQRAKPRPTKPRGTMPAIGATVRVCADDVLFAGMTGKVVEQRNRHARIDFGGRTPIDIEAWLLTEDDVEATPSREDTPHERPAS